MGWPRGRSQIHLFAFIKSLLLISVSVQSPKLLHFEKGRLRGTLLVCVKKLMGDGGKKSQAFLSGAQ